MFTSYFTQIQYSHNSINKNDHNLKPGHPLLWNNRLPHGDFVPALARLALTVRTAWSRTRFGRAGSGVLREPANYIMPGLGNFSRGRKLLGILKDNQNIAPTDIQPESPVPSDAESK